MRNREAARYARWSAGIAVAICLIVSAVYLQGRMRGGSRGNNVKPIPAAVAQQSAEFTFSKSVGPQRLFVVHASQATQFKDQNRSLLENVTITIYGVHGERDDSVRADECNYEPETGSIRCHGVVQIGLRNAKSRTGDGMQLQTSDILFERDSGKVSTDKAVTLQFADGQGQGTGVLYDPQSEDVTIEKNVQLEIAASKKSGGLPVNLTGSTLEFRRQEDSLRVLGPVHVMEGARTLSAGVLEVQLDSAMRPQHASATGNPQISDGSARGKSVLSAARMEAEFAETGTLERLIADEDVRGESRGAGDACDSAMRNFSAQHVELEMADENGASEPRKLLARGNVQMETKQREEQRQLKTESLEMEFAALEGGHGVRVSKAETLAPAEVVTGDAKESSRIRAAKLEASFGARSELTGLNGSGGVEIARTPAGKSEETSTAENFSAVFTPNGDWQTIQESGDVKFNEDGHSGRANQAQMVRQTNEVTLSGAASVEDASSRLKAAKIRINQTSGDVQAKGGVVASYFGKPGGRNAKQSGASFGQAAINILADEMNGTGFAESQTPQGHAVFLGHARMWAGSNVLQADTIEMWQSDERAEARGNVSGEFVEAANTGAPQRMRGGKAAPVLWQVHAAKVDYWNDTGRMEWSGGVKAHSSEGDISSETLELSFMKDAGNRQTLALAIASGGVRIEQNGRVGTAERGEYIANEGKFVLSGGEPAIADASGNRTTGHELTFFLANDSIVVDSGTKPEAESKPR